MDHIASGATPIREAPGTAIQTAAMAYNRRKKEQ